MPERTPADCLARIQRGDRTTHAERLRAGRHIAWPLEFNALGEWNPIYPHPDAPGPTTTPFERKWGIPPVRVGFSPSDDRDLAVEARRGGRLIILMYRHAIYAPVCPLLNISEFGKRSDRDMARGVTDA